MKKTIMTIAIILGIGMTTFAQDDRYYASENAYEGEGGLFGLGSKMFSRGNRDGGLLDLPDAHGEDDDQEAMPLGSGVAVLLGLGGAYLIAKRRKEE